MNISAVVMPRDKAVAAVAPYDEDLAEKLKTPTPMKLTALVLAHGGWSVCGLGRNVGLA